MERRTPQEKKRLSYLKDRRNAYGENDKSSRKNVPRSRRARHHQLRRGEQLALRKLTVSGGAVDESEVRFGRPGTGSWRKWADSSHADVVIHHLERRVERGGTDPGQAAERIGRIRRHARRPGGASVR
ncbi:hypothetical protein J5Y04_40290 [Kitasatospora sp. RG8]|uniref:hypothetical protein n=1 Tax=Kitasatospora sp. RG8 TaxID=2820815 RepID=UPI001AE0CED0|nr:hypothetical protein [Kitasatospora sp. RG8]MBP0455719.1 hypothetical protein [Kitasatospora sp. RG8]